MMDRLGIEEDEPIESKMVSRAVESAQKRVEGNNFDSRKTILSYDDVLREQRKIIYEQRMQIIESESNVREIVEGMIETTIAPTVETNTAEEEVENWNLQSIIVYVNSRILNEGELPIDDINNQEPEEIKSIILKKDRKSVV